MEVVDTLATTERQDTSPIIFLAQPENMLITSPRNMECLNVVDTGRFSRELSLHINGAYPTVSERELALGELFKKGNEPCVDGICRIGRYKRVKWEQVFVLCCSPNVYGEAGVGPDIVATPDTDDTTATRNKKHFHVSEQIVLAIILQFLIN